MMTRCGILIALFAGALVLQSELGAPHVVTSAETLVNFPRSLGRWNGENVALEPDVITAAAVDDYLNRSYRASDSTLGLYIGYYQSQRQGEALHSPLYCLPGAGWQPQSNRRLDLQLQGVRPQSVNQLVVERGLDRLLVLYWYQTFARVTASEYWRKLFLMHDAFVSGRTDVALVRIVTSMESRDPNTESRAVDLVRPFAELVLPEVQQRLFQK
jgi:EpsI family protein